MKSQKIKGIEHLVFEDRKEFERHFLIEHGVVPKLLWWEEAEIGDWAEANDGGIAQILYRKTYTERKHRWKDKPYQHPRTMVRTVVGTFVVDKEKKRDYLPYVMDTDFDKHKSRYTLNGLDTGIAHRMSKKSLSKADKRFIELYALGQDPRNLIANIWPKANYTYKIKELMGREVIVSGIKENIKKAAEKSGVTDEWFFKNIKKLAEDSKSDRLKFDALIKVGQVIGTVPDHDAPSQHSLQPASNTGFFKNINPELIEEVLEIQPKGGNNAESKEESKPKESNAKGEDKSD